MALMNLREPTTLSAGEGCPGEGRTPAAIRDQHRSDLSAPSRTPTLLPGRGTKLLSIQTSPVTNVMLVNKPPAGHQGTTQAQTRSGGQRAPTLSLGAGSARPSVCWWEGITRGQPSSSPLLATRKWGGGGAMRGLNGVLPSHLLHPAPAGGLGPRSPPTPDPCGALSPPTPDPILSGSSEPN